MKKCHVIFTKMPWRKKMPRFSGHFLLFLAWTITKKHGKFLKNVNGDMARFVDMFFNKKEGKMQQKWPCAHGKFRKDFVILERWQNQEIAMCYKKTVGNLCVNLQCYIQNNCHEFHPPPLPLPQKIPMICNKQNLPWYMQCNCHGFYK